MTVPDHVWEQFLPRKDDQIGMQELLAVPLLFSTFSHLVQRSLLLLAVDNQSVLHSLIQGRAGAADLNFAVGKHWLDIARLHVSMHVLRVESKANIADGASRGDYTLMEHLGATYVPPSLPQWCSAIWSPDLPVDWLD